MTAGWSCRGAAGAAGTARRWRAALAAIGKRGRYCEMGRDECAGEGQPRHPGPHDGRARQRCLDRKRRLLCLEAEWRKRGARISSFIAASEPLSSTAVVRDFPSEAARLDSPVAHPCSQPPTSRSAAVQARPVGVIDIAGLYERYGRCRISSSARRLMSKRPAPPQAGRAVGDQRRDTISTVAG